PAAAADEIVAARGISIPGPSYAGSCGGRRGRSLGGLLRHAAPLHESAEQFLRLPYHVGVVFFHLHHGHAGVGVHGDHLGHSRPQRKAFDPAGEFFRKQECAIQGLLHRACLLGGNENGLHASAPRLAAVSPGQLLRSYREQLGPDRATWHHAAFSLGVFARHLDAGPRAGLAASMLETLSMAVYTDVAAEDLALFLAGYDIGELLAYKGIAEGVENSNFLVHTSRGYFILTLYERRVAERDLPFFLALMEHLASRGITCPQPVKNRSGETLGRLAGRPAAMVTFLE